MSLPPENDVTVDEQAARAGWLYYVGGMTQDQIALELGVSRQRAQRLVARAMSEGLIRVRIEHPIRAALELEQELRKAFGLRIVRVALSLARTTDPVRALAPVAADEIERIFSSTEPIVVALGTGRTLRAVVDEMQSMDCARHKVVSLIGNVAPDGSASFFEVIMRIADKTNAPHYPMAVPVMAKDPADREHYHSLPHVLNTRQLAQTADYTLIGIGQMDATAPLLVDGFVSPKELQVMVDNGAVGEIVGWAYDAQGQYISTGLNEVVNGVQVPQNKNPIIGIAAGVKKRLAILAALRGGLINGLITDEETAKFILNSKS